VFLVEYGDFECPYCGRAYPIVKVAQESLGGALAVVYRHFPLSESHPYATIAAEASEAAGAQSAFWPMHDLLFEHQDALDEQSLIGYADALALDIDRFARELADRVYLPKVRGDFRGGVRSGVNATPTFFVNGSRYDGDWSDPRAFVAVLAEAAGARTR
jgi:protein-disulfide isomerase